MGITLIKQDDTQADFQQGVLTNVVAVNDGLELPTITWDFEDSMDTSANWTPVGTTVIQNGGTYQFFPDTTITEPAGMERLDVVSFPFTAQVKIKFSADTNGASIYISDGVDGFIIKFAADEIEGHIIDNTVWQDYLIVCHDSNNATIYHLENGEWVQIINKTSVSYTTNRLLFYILAASIGTFYVDDVKYAFTDYTPTGNRISTIDLSQVDTISDSLINWSATEPTGTSVVIETSVDGQQTWQTATSGQPIPNLPADVSNITLAIRQTLSTTDTTVTPTLSILKVTVAGVVSGINFNINYTSLKTSPIFKRIFTVFKVKRVLPLWNKQIKSISNWKSDSGNTVNWQGKSTNNVPWQEG